MRTFVAIEGVTGMGAALNNRWRDGVSDVGEHRERVGRRNLQAAPVLEGGQGRLDGAQLVGLLRVLSEVVVELSDRDERRLPA